MKTYRTVLSRKIFNDLKRYLTKWANGTLKTDDPFSMMSNVPFDEHEDKMGISTPYYALCIKPVEGTLEVAIFEDFNNVKKGSCLTNFNIDGNWITIQTKKMILELISVAEIESQFGVSFTDE